MYQKYGTTSAEYKKRGRSYEQEILPEYLDKINQGYLEYIKQQKDLNVLVIDVSDKDFVENHQDYLSILELIANSVE